MILKGILIIIILIILVLLLKHNEGFMEEIECKTLLTNRNTTAVELKSKIVSNISDRKINLLYNLPDIKNIMNNYDKFQTSFNNLIGTINPIIYAKSSSVIL